MKNLFEATCATEIRSRVESLRPDSQKQWGAMTVAQMMSHCSAWLEMAASGTSSPRRFVGRIIGGVVKKSILGEGTIRRNMPTDKALIRNNDCDFAEEQRRLVDRVHQFSSEGPEKYKTHSHSFFGPMTPLEWATLGYKHLDHHLRQFGA
jgi:hypothetical protein